MSWFTFGPVRGGVGLLLAIGLGLVLVACGGSTSGQPDGSATTIRVEASEFRFTPASVELQAGQPVTIELVNRGQTEHDLQVVQMPASMTGMGHSGHGGGEMVHAHAGAGGTDRVTFTPEHAGTYQVICTIPGHREAGMTGSLVVR